MLTIVRRIPMKEYFAALRNAPLEAVPTGEEIFVYRDARIELRDVWPNEVNPSTFYLLDENLQRQYALREFFRKEYGVDTLALSECLQFQDEAGEQWVFTPPVVEVVEELVMFPQRLDRIACDRQLRIQTPELVDGAHRMYMALQDSRKCRVIWITGARSWEHPLYAYPNGWDEVKLYKQRSDIPLKKLYRRTDPYSYLRPLRVLGFTGGPGR